MTKERKLLKLNSAAEILDVSHWTLRNWISEGRLRSVKLGALRMIPIDEVERLAKDGLSDEVRT